MKNEEMDWTIGYERPTGEIAFRRRIRALHGAPVEYWQGLSLRVAFVGCGRRFDAVAVEVVIYSGG